ncbi:MAG: hypothetical protein LBS18_06940 [Clostridiales bacterium]|jgi:hypothetical protein|nr:hypothetical protein [Clostridiales bacterium]
MKQFYVLIGNFGSGKTEISLHIALDAAKRNKKVVMVDLDVINPYFRLAERKKEIEAAGIKLLHPNFAYATVDVPSLPPDIYSVFIDKSDVVVFDVGGDPAGATALGQYKPNFEAIEAGQLEAGQLQVLCVVNPRRPFSATAELVLDMLSKIQLRSRLSINGFINNGNLSTETTAEDLRLGYDVLKRVADTTGIPVLYTAGRAAPLREFLDGKPDARYIGQVLQITTYMHRDWDNFTRYGI